MEGSGQWRKIISNLFIKLKIVKLFFLFEAKYGTGNRYLFRKFLTTKIEYNINIKAHINNHIQSHIKAEQYIYNTEVCMRKTCSTQHNNLVQTTTKKRHFQNYIFYCYKVIKVNN